MRLNKQRLIIYLIVAFLLGGVVSWGVVEAVNRGLLGNTVKVSTDDYKQYEKLSQRYGKLDALYETVNTQFYKKVKEQDLIDGMYKGVVAGLGDPYSAYMTKKEYDSWSADTLGEFDGIGITFSMNTERDLIVVSTIDGTPAYRAGIKAGDIIEGVDGKVYTNMDDAAAAMRGKAGTKVEITYSRKDKVNTAVLTRETIVTESVQSKIRKDNIGYIRITAFEEHTAEDFEKALDQMEKKKVQGIVIDLRDNGGGVVEAGLEIADKLLGKQAITYLQDRQGKKKYYNSDGQRTKLPYAILVNEGTASTSEIVTAAVKDEGKHPIVGTKTFGKGIVQVTSLLKEGDALKLTTMQYFSPKGNVINSKGITPNYVVKIKEDSKKDTQMEKAITLLK